MTTTADGATGRDLTSIGVPRFVRDELAELAKANGRAIWEEIATLLEARRVRNALRRDAEVIKSLSPEQLAAHTSPSAG
ncbi:hypothetical protein AB0H43_22545 [Hamadaea sp. NPDC050747]|uniref:hypothetical protein n=1 Tax=Hamadaea sp. NPDC050747 TaxID=3155789 RepID=UPI003404FFCB